MEFREFLRRIRLSYNTDRNRTYKRLGIPLAVLIIAGFLADIFLPFGGTTLGMWSNVIRAVFIVLPTGVIGFWLAYMVSLSLHYGKMETDKDWVPFRLRYSLSWRRSMAAVVAAVLVVGIWAIGQHPGYSLWASIILMSVGGLLAFIRPTKFEMDMEEQGIPDPRDRKFRERMAKQKEESERRIQQKQEKRDARLKRLMGSSNRKQNLENELAD